MLKLVCFCVFGDQNRLWDSWRTEMLFYSFPIEDDHRCGHLFSLSVDLAMVVPMVSEIYEKKNKRIEWDFDLMFVFGFDGKSPSIDRSIGLLYYILI